MNTTAESTKSNPVIGHEAVSNRLMSNYLHTFLAERREGSLQDPQVIADVQGYLAKDPAMADLEYRSSVILFCMTVSRIPADQRRDLVEFLFNPPVRKDKGVDCRTNLAIAEFYDRT